MMSYMMEFVRSIDVYWTLQRNNRLFIFHAFKQIKKKTLFFYYRKKNYQLIIAKYT